MKEIRTLYSIIIFVALILRISGYEVPRPEVVFYQNGGFEVSIPADPAISLFAFHGEKNVLLQGREAGTWNADIINATHGRMVFVDPNTKFNLGDRLHFWVYVIADDLGHELLNQMEEVKSFGVPSPGVTVQKTNYEFKQQIRFLNPRGFEVSIPVEDGLTRMAFHGKINEPFLGLEAGTISQDVNTPEDGRLRFTDYVTELKPGDKLYFWIHVVFKGLSYNLLDQHYEYRGDEIIK